MLEYILEHGTYSYGSTFSILFFISRHIEIIAVPLILLLSLKMILQGSKLWNRHLATSLDMAIYPLLLSYGVVVFFKVINTVTQNFHI